MRILIVKTSSLGDVIHTLPALTDASRAIPGLQADWVVEEAFAQVPGWHPAVDRVIPVAIRRWRNDWRRTWRSGQIGLFRSDLRVHQYDHVIDAQGLLKSAIITLMARGPVAGLDRNSAREPMSALFYSRRLRIPRAEHAVHRVRQLFAGVLGYAFDPETIDYGLARQFPGASGVSHDVDVDPASAPVLTFLHGTTWASKHWPEQYWRKLAVLAERAGYAVQLPWGNEVEYERAVRIADGLESVSVMERTDLSGLARHIAASAGVVAVDTGLGHLAAALNRPAVSIYGATNPTLSGTFGYHQLQLKSDLACAPCLRRQCLYDGQPLQDEDASGNAFVVEPACYRAAPPEQVLKHLQRMMQQASGGIRV